MDSAQSDIGITSDRRLSRLEPGMLRRRDLTAISLLCDKVL